MNSKFLTLLFFVTLFTSCSKDKGTLIYIASTKVDCVGVAHQKCLQIKEREADLWSNFYGTIEGFDFEEGYQYKLKVAVSKNGNPPADAYSQSYTLLKILEKIKMPLSISKGTWLVVKVKDIAAFSRNPVIEIDLSEGKIKGSTGCNRFSGNIVIKGKEVKISNVATTKMMCKDIENETTFIKVLNQAALYKIEGDSLFLFSKDGETLMECRFTKE